MRKTTGKILQAYFFAWINGQIISIFSKIQVKTQNLKKCQIILIIIIISLFHVDITIFQLKSSKSASLHVNKANRC